MHLPYKTFEEAISTARWLWEKGWTRSKLYCYRTRLGYWILTDSEEMFRDRRVT